MPHAAVEALTLTAANCSCLIDEIAPMASELGESFTNFNAPKRRQVLNLFGFDLDD